MPLFKTLVAVTYNGTGGNDYISPDLSFSPPGRGTFLVPRVPVQFWPALSRSTGTSHGMNANEVSLKTPRWYMLTQTQPGVQRTKQALASSGLRRYNLIGSTRGTTPVSKRGA